MRKVIVKFLSYLIWLTEGHAGRYYSYRWQMLWSVSLPKLVLELRKAAGYKPFAHEFNVIDAAHFYDGEKILTGAIAKNNDQQRRRNWKKAQLSVERWAREHRGERLPDIEHEDSLHSEAKLTRTEAANADGFYRQLSFGRGR